MASSSNDQTPIYLAIVFAIIAVALGITTYMSATDASKLRTEATNANNAKSASDAAFKTKDDDVKALKELVGYQADKVGGKPGDPEDATSVVGVMKSEMRKLTGVDNQPNLLEAMRRLKSDVDAAVADRDALRTKLDTVEKQILKDLQDSYESRTQLANDRKKEAEQKLLARISEYEENEQAKDTKIAELRKQYEDIQLEFDNLKQSSEALLKKREDEVKNLNLRILKLNEDLAEINKPSFEVGDGKIVRVDNTVRLVWIDLGQADFLKPRTTFSVYEKNKISVGRGPEDVKGKIEVTRITGAHIAECRIVDEDVRRPISPNDIIYSPIWSPGLVEKFAFVGFLDIDGDGRSDRELVHQVLANVGAGVATEVDDEGERSPGRITEETKFLVRGHVPEIAEAETDEQRKLYRKMLDELDTLKKEALEHGVQTISLGDFIHFVGYKPKRRLYVPGDGKPFQLKSGAASQGVGGAIGDTTSSGTTADSLKKRGANTNNFNTPPSGLNSYRSGN